MDRPVKTNDVQFKAFYLFVSLRIATYLRSDTSYQGVCEGGEGHTHMHKASNALNIL